MPCRKNPGGTHGAASEGPNASALSPLTSCLLEKPRAIFRILLQLPIDGGEACRAHKTVESLDGGADRHTGTALDAVL